MCIKEINRMIVIAVSIFSFSFFTATAIAQDWSQMGSSAEDELIFVINSYGTLRNGAQEFVEMTLDKTKTITLIRTYHWNYGRGQDPGSFGQLEVRDTNDNMIKATAINYAENGFGNVLNCYWVASGGVGPAQSGPIRATLSPLDWELGPGTYRIYDPDPTTWSNNDETGGKGITFVYARKSS
jgi:hypothetical protein